MKFLVDAQLPRRQAHRLREAGYEVLHTLDLPDGNRTTDSTINSLSEREGHIVITKDADFINSFLLSGRPRKLLLISVGNCSNADLESLFVPRIPEISAIFSDNDYVELSRAAIIHA